MKGTFNYSRRMPLFDKSFFISNNKTKTKLYAVQLIKLIMNGSVLLAAVCHHMPHYIVVFLCAFFF